MNSNRESFEGFLRKDGKVGTRNYLAIIPTVFCVNEVVAELATLVPGTKPLVHMHGCCELKTALDQTTHTLRGLIQNPNVGGCVVVSLGCEGIESSDLLAAAEKEGKPTILLTLQEEGGMKRCIDRHLEDVRSLKSEIDEAERLEFDPSHIIAGIKCGSSDATSGLAANPAAGIAADILAKKGGVVIFGETTEFIGAEHFLAKRCRTPEVRRHLLELVERVEKRALRTGVDMRGSQPTPGNIRGGLTTIEEKSLGAIIKSGSQPIEGVLEYAQPVRGRGVFAMDSPGKENEVMTGLAAVGVNLIVFTTGGGAPQGFPLVPVIKVASNPEKVSRMKEHIDIDVSDILKGGLSVEEAGERIFKTMLDVAGGTVTKAEELGYDKTIGIFLSDGDSI